MIATMAACGSEGRCQRARLADLAGVVGTCRSALRREQRREWAKSLNASISALRWFASNPLAGTVSSCSALLGEVSGYSRMSFR